jgi:Peptidase family M28
MIRKYLVLYFLLVANHTFAQQDPIAIKSIIASDVMEGRETGKRGQKMAAAFIASYFEELGLVAPVNGNYYQPVPLYITGAPAVALRAGSVEFTNEEYMYAGSFETAGMVDMPIMFAGNGSETEIDKMDLNGKAVMFLSDPAVSVINNSLVRALRDKGAMMVFTAIEKDDDFKRITNATRSFTGGRLSLTKQAGQSTNTGLFYLNAQSAGKIFNTTLDKLKKSAADKKLDKVKPATISYSIAQSYREVRSENILGFLEGTDKKDEVVVITAHYDHIGISTRAEGDKINNGADDDGSGTVAVLAMAKAFVQAKKDGKGPRRSILFMTVTGEEKGLLGSRYYTDNPVYSLSNTVANLNIDMIGRRDPQHKDSAPYVYVIGSDKLSTELHTLSESTNKTYTNLIFDYTYNDEKHPERIYYRSDHWNFAKNNIPIVFYFDGVHEDYHKPSDEVDKIEFDLLAARAKTVFHTAWEIANRENRLIVDKK